MRPDALHRTASERTRATRLEVLRGRGKRPFLGRSRLSKHYSKGRTLRRDNFNLVSIMVSIFTKVRIHKPARPHLSTAQQGTLMLE